MLKVLFVVVTVLSILAESVEVQTIRPTAIRDFALQANAVVLFCDPGAKSCDFSKAMFEHVARTFTENPFTDDEIQFGFISSSGSFISIAKSYGSETGNDFVYFKNGKIHNSIRASKLGHQAHLTQFIEDSHNAFIREYSTTEEFNAEVKDCSGEYSTVVYFAAEPDHETEEFLLKFNFKYDDIFQVKAVRDPSLVATLGGKNNVIKVFQCYDHELTKEFTRDVDDDLNALEEWILHRGTPLVAKGTQSTITRGIKLFGLCILIAVPEGQENQIISMVTPLAKKLKNTAFVWDNQENLEKHFIDVGATGNMFPTAIALQSLHEIPLVWNERENFNEKNIDKWIQDIHAGTVEKFLKSAPIPSKTTSGGLQELVYDNFESTIYGDGKSSLVLYYGRPGSCPDCGNTISVLEKIATSKKYPVDMFTYSITENYLVEKVTRVPEMYVYKNGEKFKFPVGKFTAANIHKWLKKIFPSAKHDEL